MAPSVALTLVLLAALRAAPAEAGANYTVFAVSKSGLMHLDSSGALLAWRPDTNQTGQVATNPRNGTVCWMRRRRYPEVGDALRYAVRCAELARLNQTWDLPLPLAVDVNIVSAFAFDEVTENWYLTVRETLHPLRKDGAVHVDVHRSYVCNYLFEKCLALLEETPGTIGKFLAAYDISNRFVSYIKVDKLNYRLILMQLDSSEKRDINTHIRDPYDLVLDPVGRHIYWLNRPAIYGNYTDVNRIDYDGQNMGRIKRIYEHDNIYAMDAVGGTVVVIRGNERIISAVDGVTREMTDLVSGAVKGGEAIPALAKVEELLAVKIVSPDTQLETENHCSSAGGGCQDFCIPKTVNNTAAVACLCPEGLQLVALECRKEHPSYAVLIGATSLQAVDLQTEQVSTILSNLTDGTRVDVLRVADAEFLLFWLDAGSLYRGRWAPGGSVEDVLMLVPAASEERVTEVAVYASQHQLFWLKRDDSDAGAGSTMVVQMSPIDDSYVKTVFVGKWVDHQDQSIFGRAAAFLLANNHFVRQRSYWFTFPRRNGSQCTNSSVDVGDLGGIVMDEPLSQAPLRERIFFTDRSTQSVEYVFVWGSFFFYHVQKGRHRLLTHPSLADAGSLDLTASRLFWTERASGRLWTADLETGGGVRALPGVAGGRSLRLIQPWRRPPVAPVCDTDRAGCSHFCLRIASFSQDPYAKCDCPDGMRLGDDEKTCQKADVGAAGGLGEYPGCSD